MLYLDDSGKIHPNETDTKVAVFAGFTVDEENWHRLVRQVSGAKVKFIPHRGGGNPNLWEIKSEDFLTPNNWLRAKKRNLCFELVSILERNNCRVYSLSMEKAKAIDPLDERKFIPLMIQRIVSKYHDQLSTYGQTGSVVCDWSTYAMDHHVTNCVCASTIGKGMERLRGGVTYGSSSALVPLQIADIIASTFRRDAEGQTHVQDLANALRKLQYRSNPADMFGLPIWSIAKLF